MMKRTNIWTPVLKSGHLTGSGSTGGDVPKSHFLRTGESKPLDDNSESVENENTKLIATDHYRTHTDRLITQRMRSALNEDPSLAPIAHRVSISTIDGNIKLQGSVPTEKDKTTIGLKAQEIAGTGNVSNQLVVQGY